MSLAQSSPQSEREAESTDWNVDQLIETWPRTGRRRYGLKRLHFRNLLTQPLKTQGILRFTPPTGLEKHITAPHDERYLVEGDTVLFESKTKGTKRTLSLHDYPVLQAFIEAFRSTLANDVVHPEAFL